MPADRILYSTPGTDPHFGTSHKKPPSCILNVDDSEAGRYAKSRILQLAGYDVIEAASGADALRLVRDAQPQLVLLDVKLPDMSGLDVCRIIKADSGTAHIMVLQISATYLSATDRAQGLDCGADTYLTEPVRSDELKATVQALLRLYNREQENRRLLAHLRESESEKATQLAELQAIYASAPVGLAVLNTDLRFVRVNKRLAEMNGIAPEQHIGRTVRQIVPGISEEAERLFRRVIESGEPLRNVEITGETAAQPGVQRTWLEHYFPLKGPDGTCIGVNVVVEDVTERKNHEEQLSQADKRKDEFLAILGHELRNPLGVIANVLRLMPPDQSGTEGSRSLRTVLDRQVTQMSRLIDDLLDVARIARGQIQLENAPCDFTAVVRDAVEDCRASLDAIGLQLNAALPERALWVLGDRTRLAQCVSNLLHNAGKFTDCGGLVEVTLARTADSDSALLSVRDTGIGMGAETLASIFEASNRGAASIERGQGGLGLGLALVKGFVTLHGGEVQALSAGPGRGSEFIIRLPLNHESVEQNETNVGDTKDAKRYRILIIDDNAVAARALSLFLTGQGHTVEIAHTGPEGVGLAKQFHPELVLCDIGLPGFDGYEVAQQIRKELLDDVLLIAVSGFGGEEFEERASRAGFDQYVMKPVDLNELERILQSCPRPNPSTREQ